MADNPPPSFSHLVVIGASAGGIEALSTVVAALPANFPAPIIIAQHLDPRRQSHLAGILGARSTLPVRTIIETTPLAPGIVYIVPPNRNVTINDHEVSVVETQDRTIKPSVDLLFSSAAQVFQEGLIAVILTGTGNDGAAGARAVKNAGGTVIIQNPETAAFPSMPLSLAPTTVDIVANLESIPGLVHDLLTGAYTPARPDTERQLRVFLEQLRERSGIDFGSYKTATLLRRLQRRMVAVGASSLTTYMQHLQRYPDEYNRLINSFLIKVTEFFRDPELFDYIRERVLPELIQEGRANGSLRIWSAGCATGEEAYSLAILLSEMLGDEMAELNVRIFATDLDADAIAFARRGIYPATALTHLPVDLIERYFLPFDGAYEIKKNIRALVVFGQHDLGQRAPFPRIDMTLCRNVLIYFTTELQRRALQLFAFGLRDGGILVLGKAESVTPLAEFFTLDEPRLKIYRRVGDRVLIPPAHIRDSVPLPAGGGGPRRRWAAGAEPAQARIQREMQRARVSAERAEVLLQRLPVGVVVVDRSFDILAINNVARRLLGIHTSAIGEDFIHLVQNVPLMSLRDAIDNAFRGAPSITYQFATTEPATGDELILEIASSPERLEPETVSVDAVVVTVADLTTQTRQRRELEQNVERQRSEAANLASQVRRLTETNRQLLEANQELTATNAGLHNVNEELLVANEEAQAATEEIETLNEELQATNEELETLNEELQATVEELNTTNDDLQARSVELQDLTVSLEEQRSSSDVERQRLSAIIGSLGDAVVVVDRQGGIVLHNETYQRLFVDPNTVLYEAGGQALAAEATPRQRAARGEEFNMVFARRRDDGSLGYYEAYGRPVQVSQEDDQWGIVIVYEVTDHRPSD